MSLKVTLTVTVTNPDTSQQHQAKDSCLTFDPDATPYSIMEKALDFLRTELDQPRLPLEENPDADASTKPSDVTDEEWENALPEVEPANA
jgi:hypothetical protein